MPRPTTGPALVYRLDGSDAAKRKTDVILATIAGTCTIDDAAEALGMDRSYVFVLRDQILAGAIAAAEPRKSGPKPAAPTLPNDPATAALRAELAAARKQAKDAEITLELERCRLELEAVMGPRLKKSGTGRRARR